MKKLIAILFSVLMLCTLIPFATVAAEDYPDVQLSIVDELEAVNAGDEFQVQVDLLGLEDTDGLISVLVEIGFDTDVFEAVTYFDEDEEMWLPSIEIGSKYNASSNKYISYGQIYDDGSMKNCLVKYMRATASATQVRREEYFCTITLKVKDNAPAGTYDLTAIQKDGLYYGNIKFEFDAINTSITVNGSDPVPPACEHEYDNACDVDCNLCGENREVSHNVIHVEANAADCTTEGNIEYWYCDVCGMAWLDEACTQNTNLKAVVLPMADHEYFYACDQYCMNCGEKTNPHATHNKIHVEAKEATSCVQFGNVEYWYCDACGTAWLDADGRYQTNQMSVKTAGPCVSNAAYPCQDGECINCGLPCAAEVAHTYFDDCSAICEVCGEEREVSHNVIHVEAVAATCTTDGNIEYWYCDVCGAAWLDAECTLNTNLKSVVLPASCSYSAVYTAAKEATCYEPGNVEYWYCANCDVYYADAACAIVTNAKNVIIPITHNIIHVEAKAATCTENGNIEYWYCDICGQAWLDELCHLNTNLKSVVLPASCSYGAQYVEAKAATCFEPGNVEYWYCANCDVYYADAACAIVTNAKNVIIPITHNIIHVEAKAATCTENGNIAYWYCADCGQAWLDELCHLNTNLKSVVLPASCSYGAQYVEAKAATCFEPGNVEYWYCANCDVYYADAACAIVTNAKNVIIPITHNIIAVEAKAATCTENGNIAYWYCADCGQAWLDELCHLNTNLKSVVLPASCSYGAQYVEAKAATCFEPGNVEYWYCANCDVYYADAACAIVTNAKNVIIPITHNIIHVEAKAATCTELGNIEYWYCADCGQAWLDELCIYNTNLKAVVLPMADHTYDNAHDADCNVCGAKREIVLSADEIILEGGKSISEIKNGLAVKFDAAVKGITYNEEYIADYTNAVVTINGVDYKLIGMGAIANNQGKSAQTLADVDNRYVLNIPAEKVFEEFSYAVRIINIPAEHVDTEITFCSYFQYECEGEIVTVYGEDIVTSYNMVANG